MPNLIEHFSSTDDHTGAPIRECRLGADPVMLYLFTDEVEEAKLHYEPDDAVRSFFPCPGDGCPHCYTGAAPQEFFLLPVYNVEQQAVEVLRISKKRGPDSLGSHLLPFLKDPEIKNKVILVSRTTNRYRVEARTLAQLEQLFRADLCS